jgi:hypothetical protein
MKCLVVDGSGIPLGMCLESASPSEVSLLERAIDDIAVPRKGRGRPRKNPRRIIADKGYDSDALRNRLAGRRGKKRATVAVAHAILAVAYQVLNNLLPCRELGADHFDRSQPERIKRALVRRVQSLGCQVQIQPPLNAA